MPPGFKRSRAIWDETKDGGIRAWIQAICYELQPIRFSKFSRKGATTTLESLIEMATSLFLAIPAICKSIIVFVSRRNSRQWIFVGAIFVYYWCVRWIHEALDAGPVVLILTALTLIFTVGLSDDESRNGLSAYSVFNKGFEQLLGSIDADSLLAQHVGGGMMMNMNPHNGAPRYERGRDNVEPPNPPRHEEEENHEAFVNEDDANGGVDRRDGNIDHNHDNNTNRARRSGKKARRRNLDQRRELRRQRELAVQIGLDGGRGEIDDAVEIQRIIENQIIAENNER